MSATTGAPSSSTQAAQFPSGCWLVRRTRPGLISKPRRRSDGGELFCSNQSILPHIQPRIFKQLAAAHRTSPRSAQPNRRMPTKVGDDTPPAKYKGTGPDWQQVGNRFSSEEAMKVCRNLGRAPEAPRRSIVPEVHQAPREFLGSWPLRAWAERPVPGQRGSRCEPRQSDRRSRELPGTRPAGTRGWPPACLAG